MYDDDNKTASECKSLEEQRAEIERRLDRFLWDINEDGPFDDTVFNDALFAFARGIERNDGWKEGRRYGEESALAHPEVTRDLIAARKAKKVSTDDRQGRRYNL